MRRSSTSTTPPATSPAPADIRVDIHVRVDAADLWAEVVRQIEWMNQYMKKMTMISGPSISPMPGGWAICGPSGDHCTHCTKAGLAGGVIGWGIPCLDHECPCRPNHLGECSCHGNFREWCDAREIWAWLNGLTNGATPIILARVTS